MGVLKSTWLRLRALLASRAVERDLDEEIQFHIEQETRKNLDAGMDEAEAGRQARLAFGSVAVTREEHRDGWGVGWIPDALADARYGLRTLRRNPGLAAAAIVTLALGIGANTAIFSAVHAVILRPLGFPGEDRLVMLWEENPEYNWYQQTAAPANVLDWRDQVGAFADVAAHSDSLSRTTLTGNGDPQLLAYVPVTGNFFSVLGVRAELGRTLTEAETWQTNTRVVVLSHRAWRDRFAADPGIVGRTIVLDGRNAEVAGVMPRSFAYPSDEVDVWTPFGWDPADREALSFRRAHWLRAIGRLRPGVTQAEANSELQVVVKRLRQEYPDINRVMGAGMTPLHAFLVRDLRQPLLVLQAAVVLLLLLACANVGNLLLAQAVGRERDAAMRLALGAGRGRLVRQALAESLALSLVGGIAGLALGWWGTRVLVALQLPGMLPARDIGMDWAVLVYVAAVTTMSGLVFGAVPAVWYGRRVPGEILKDGGRGGTAGRRMRRWGGRLVVAELAVALLLTVGASLLVRSFWQLATVHPGFDPEGVLDVRLNANGPRYDSDDKLRTFYRDLVARARSLPGVESAAAAAQVPLTSYGWTGQFSVGGRPPGEYGPEVAHREVTPGYFEVMRVPIVRGRDFTDHDGPDAPPVVLINEALARQYFRGQDPIGQKVAFEKSPDERSTWRTIVGIVGDERQASLAAETKIQFISPYAQDPRPGMHLVLRTKTDPAALAAPVRRLVAELDPDLAIAAVRTMKEVRSTSLAGQRFLMTMLVVFGGVGLLLAVVGVYGVMAQFARGRTREIGIRLALGARASEVRWLVVRRGLALVVPGLSIGVCAALAAAGVLRSLLFGITPRDPATFTAVPVLLLLAAAAATWFPAVRASRTDPALTLREE